jgi:pantoate--beta-alanine ligase
MDILRTVEEMRAWSRLHHKYDHEVGFVPTMGALHRGHLALVDRAVAENDVAVASIFVNPTQFMPGEDFETYPRDEEADLAKLEAAGVEAVFLPATETMYGAGGSLTSVFVAELSDPLCGMSRGRGHFRGVCTVVTKLFNIVEPDRAYFGQKDAQQAIIIGRLVADLNLPVEVVVCPTVREEDGLALSSRNARLAAAERREALALYRALARGRALIRGGERAAMVLLEAMYEELEAHEAVEVDYLQIVDPDALQDVEWIDDVVLLAGAVRVGETRLIDNLIVHPEDGPWEEPPPGV